MSVNLQDLQLEIEYLPVDRLVPYVNNARTHSEAQVDEIAASIKEFGFRNPILIDETESIIAGHGRLMAARKLEMIMVPCIRCRGLTPIQVKALILADNRIALNAGWNMDLLGIELKTLKDAGWNTEILGFNDKELTIALDTLNPKGGHCDDDHAPKVAEKVVSQRGEIWTLSGGHRLMCGDSTDLDDVQSLVEGQSVDLLFTDPPYGMGYGGGRAAGDHVRDKGTGNIRIKAHGEILGDDLRGEELETFLTDCFTNAKMVLKAGASSYIWCTWRNYKEFEQAMVAVGFTPKGCIVWDKGFIGLGYSHYRPQHEFAIYTDGQWYGDKTESDVWAVRRGNTQDYVHPTQKPVELAERALKNSTKQGDVILDLFGGSGSTLIGCHKTARCARLMELDPKYIDVILKRFSAFTKTEPVLEGSGQTFIEAAYARGVDLEKEYV